MNNDTVVNNENALNKDEVQLKAVGTSNRGSVAFPKAQMYATIIPKVTVPYYLWV